MMFSKTYIMAAATQFESYGNFYMYSTDTRSLIENKLKVTFMDQVETSADGKSSQNARYVG